MITVVTMLWRDGELARRGCNFRPWHVRRLRDQVAHHLAQPHRFVCVCDEPEWLFDIETAPLDGSLVIAGKRTPRLQLFRRDAGELLGGTRLLHIALGAEIVGPLDPLVDRDEPLVLLRNPAHGERRRFAPFSSAVMLLTAGCMPAAYEDFMPRAIFRTPWSSDACDWISTLAPSTVATFGPEDGIHDETRLPRAWSSSGARSTLPAGSRMVTFSTARAVSSEIGLGPHPWLELDRTAAKL
jgi:hypothetical protein